MPTIMLSPIVVAGLCSLTGLYLLTSILWLASQRPGYSHRKHTISELGASGSPLARATAWGSFVPVGVLFCGSILAVRPFLPADEQVTQGVLLVGLTGAGYVFAALFPCDAGAPSLGSGTNQLHNLGAGISYMGALGGLDILHRSLEDTASWSALGAGSRLAFVGLALGVLGIVVPNPVRGLFQRVGEVAIFGWLAFAGWMVARLG